MGFDGFLFSVFLGLEFKMGGKRDGFCQIGRGVKGKQVHSSIQPENGRLILMIKVIISFFFFFWLVSLLLLCVFLLLLRSMIKRWIEKLLLRTVSSSYIVASTHSKMLLNLENKVYCSPTVFILYFLGFRNRSANLKLSNRELSYEFYYSSVKKIN